MKVKFSSRVSGLSPEFLRYGVALLLALLLGACGGRYQAPLDDQSSILERSAPPIYSTNGTSSAGGVTAGTPVNSISTSAAAVTPVPPSTTPARTIAAGVRVDPAAGVNVNVASQPSGVGRSPIARTALDGNTTAVAGAATAGVSAPVSPVGAAPTHAVQRGETLYSIAWQYSLDYRALALANNLAAPYTIYPDQQLSVNIASVSDNAMDRLPVIPPAPAGDTTIAPPERPAAAVASRRTGNVPSREVDDIVWQWPVEGRVLRSFNASANTTSRGIDIGGKRGDPVYAAADGDVVYSGRGIQGQGDLIIIRHSARHLSAYSHNSTMLVSAGARIQVGDKIAEIGTDPRGSELLHFEVRVDGKPVDPTQYLPSR